MTTMSPKNIFAYILGNSSLRHYLITNFSYIICKKKTFLFFVLIDIFLGNYANHVSNICILHDACVCETL